jgi:hypothetical protein
MNDSRKKAYQLIILFGIVSLLGDIIYEGARSVNGQYLATLGVSAATVGLVSGVGEFLGYAVRLASGYYSDKTGTYWLFTIIGYALLISVRSSPSPGYGSLRQCLWLPSVSEKRFEALPRTRCCRTRHPLQAEVSDSDFTKRWTRLAP